MPMRKQVDYDELRSNWRIVAGSTLGMSIGTASIVGPSLGIFFTAIASDFGWSMRDMSALMLPFGVTCFVSSVVFGGLLDKIGVRPILILGYVSFVVAMAGLAMLPESWPVLLVWMMVVAMSGLANGGMPFARIINERFDSCRGLALGALTMGVGTVGIAVPVVAALLVESWGWRSAYATFGVVVACLAPVALAAVWNVSGRPYAPTDQRSRQSVGHGYSSLVRSRAMWTMVLAVALISVGLNGYLIHIIPMLNGSGFTLVEAAYAQSLFSVAMILSRISTGAAIDRFFAPYVSAVTCVAAACGMLLIVWAGGNTPALTFIGVALIGVAYGAEADVLAYIMSRYFGLASFGKSYGMLHGLGILAAGLSPLLIAQFSEEGANYDKALYITAGLLALGAIVFVSAPRFETEAGAEESHDPAAGFAPAASNAVRGE